MDDLTEIQQSSKQSISGSVSNDKSERVETLNEILEVYLKKIASQIIIVNPFMIFFFFITEYKIP